MSAVAENIQTQMPEPIVFTDNAAAKVADLIAEEGNPDLKLRVFVQGGGCSGFQYGFTFDEITNEDDTTMSKNGVSLLIDAMSYQYLVGAEIDYKLRAFKVVFIVNFRTHQVLVAHGVDQQGHAVLGHGGVILIGNFIESKAILKA